MKNYKTILSFGILLGLFLGLVVLTPVIVQAVGDVQLENPIGTTDINTFLGSVIKNLLKVLGSIALVVFVVGGFLWLTSAGNAEKVKLGTNTMLYAIIGLFIIFSSYAILNTVIGGLIETKQVTGETTTVSEKEADCKAQNQDWSCLPIDKCEGVGVPTTADKAGYTAACTAASSTCINSKCSEYPENVKCCQPKAGVATVQNTPVGDGCGGTDHPNWSCRDINHCDIPLGTENNLTKQRSICKASTGSCILGKCDGGDGIVCCAEAEKGSCMIGDKCQESKGSLVMNQHNCDALEGTFSFETCAQRESSQTDCGCEVKDLDNLCKKRTVENCTFDSLCQLDLVDICVEKVATPETVDEHADDYNALAGKCRTLKKGSCEADTNCQCTK